MLRRYLQLVPYRSRPAFLYESLYSIGRGCFIALWPFSWVVLKTELGGELWHLAAIGSLWGLAGLVAPVWARLGRRVGLRRVVVWPNVAAGFSLVAVAFVSGPTSFVLLMVTAFLTGAPTRLTEMGLYRVLYPASHRSLAVGFMKGIGVVSGSAATLAGTWLIGDYDSSHGIIYALVGILMMASAWFYGKIPIPRSAQVLTRRSGTPRARFSQVLDALSANPRFLRYQRAFFFAGFGNFMSMALVAEVMREGIDAPVWALGAVVAIFPFILQPISAPFWGRYLDRVSPMRARAVFSSLMVTTYSFYCYGGVTLQLWPFLTGSLLQGITTSGNHINWTTGNLYFARSEHVSLYNNFHMASTGVRALIAPLVGAWLFSWMQLGPWVFAISAMLAAVGGFLMLRLERSDGGISQEQEEAATVSG